jgi:putative membrane protein
MPWTQKSSKWLNVTATFLSAVILLFVIFMRKIHLNSSIDFTCLPMVYSSLNFICAFVLTAAFIQIKKGHIQNHKRLMTTAILISFVFLICYVTYHITSPEVKFCGTGAIRVAYFILLISHITLSGICFPFILFAYIRGLTQQVERHKKLAKIIFPLWLYICVSGPLCYILLYPCIK